ncbi:MAG: HupE/UreJ family protein [Deltaproteobacteria bacterium]|nr:HupE/UreJ family protein [Deltaproteobacteria bacterium]
MDRKTRLAIVIAPVLLLLLSAETVLAHGISDADKMRMIEGGLLQYVWLGAIHMLTGYDHLLFIFGVIFFLSGAKDVLKYITVFTIGHSITLIFATIYGITANYFLIDAVIALSVIYKGFDNVDGFRKYLGTSPPTILYMIFAFGFIHGFGLSTRLQQLPLGDPTGLIARILSFNAGVELGQIVALCIMLILIVGWRKSASFNLFSKVSNYGLIAAGVALFIMQMHGYMHTVYPDEFGFSADNHYHEHEKMDMLKGLETDAGSSETGNHDTL